MAVAVEIWAVVAMWSVCMRAEIVSEWVGRGGREAASGSREKRESTWGAFKDFCRLILGLYPTNPPLAGVFFSLENQPQHFVVW